LLENKGVQIWYESTEDFEKDGKVRSDIDGQLHFQKISPSVRAKTWQELQHDVMLWNFVNKQRAVGVTNPLRARYWVVTIDESLRVFDGYKKKVTRSDIELCIGPTQFVQMLQLWVPRSIELEQVVLGSLRLPLLATPFTPGAESAIMQILSVMSTLESIEQMSVEEISGYLANQALRQRMVEEPNIEKQRQLLREAMIEQNKKLSIERDEALRTVDQYKSSLESSDTKLVALQEQLRKQQADAAAAESTVNAERTILEARLAALEQSAEQQKSKKLERDAKNRFLIIYGSSLVCCLVVAVALTIALTNWSQVRAIPQLEILAQIESWKLILGIFCLLLIVLLWLSDWYIAKRPVLLQWPLCIWIRRVRNRLFFILSSIVLGVAGNAASKVLLGS
jgi:hypothetical protein